MSVTNKPQIEAYIGASGSGKGVSINERLRELQPRRLVIWDPRNEYTSQARPVTTLRELVQDLARAGRNGPIRVRYVPGGAVDPKAAFAVVCKAVFAAGGLVFVAEELSDVTSPGWAPPAWRRITTQGRHEGLHVLGAAQRPTLIDKTFLGNCTRVRCFQLGYDDDIKAMAKEVRAPIEAIGALVTTDQASGADIGCLEYHRRTRELWSVQIKVRRSSGATETRAPFVAKTPTRVPAKPARARKPT